MKATYFFSKKQLNTLQEIAKGEGKIYRNNFINGKQYTEVKTKEGQHESNWDDAIVVAVREGLPVDEFWLNRFGVKNAKI